MVGVLQDWRCLGICPFPKLYVDSCYCFSSLNSHPIFRVSAGSGGSQLPQVTSPHLVLYRLIECYCLSKINLGAGSGLQAAQGSEPSWVLLGSLVYMYQPQILYEALFLDCFCSMKTLYLLPFGAAGTLSPDPRAKGIMIKLPYIRDCTCTMSECLLRLSASSGPTLTWPHSFITGTPNSAACTPLSEYPLCSVPGSAPVRMS